MHNEKEQKSYKNDIDFDENKIKLKIIDKILHNNILPLEISYNEYQFLSENDIERIYPKKNTKTYMNNIHAKNLLWTANLPFKDTLYKKTIFDMNIESFKSNPYEIPDGQYIAFLCGNSKANFCEDDIYKNVDKKNQSAIEKMLTDIYRNINYEQFLESSNLELEYYQNKKSSSLLEDIEYVNDFEKNDIERKIQRFRNLYILNKQSEETFLNKTINI